MKSEPDASAFRLISRHRILRRARDSLLHHGGHSRPDGTDPAIASHSCDPTEAPSTRSSLALTNTPQNQVLPPLRSLQRIIALKDIDQHRHCFSADSETVAHPLTIQAPQCNATPPPVCCTSSSASSPRPNFVGKALACIAHRHAMKTPARA